MSKMSITVFGKSACHLRESLWLTRVKQGPVRDRQRAGARDVFPRLAETILFMGKASKVLQLTGKVTARDHVSLATRLEHVFSTTAWQSIDLELKIDELRHELAQKMIAMLFKEYNLQGYFWTLKEFFMLTNGEFYLGFMNGAQKLLSGPLTANHENGTSDLIRQHHVAA